MVPVIRKITWRHAHFPIGGGLRNASSPMAGKHLLVVFAEDEQGRMGLGECWLEPAYRDTIELRLAGVALSLNGCAADEALEKVTAMQLEYADGSDREVMAALSGIDMALWDLKARSAGLPLYEAIRQTLPKRVAAKSIAPVRCYASAGLYRPRDSSEELAAEVELYRLMGYDAFKVKVGGAELEHDVARIAALRSELGPEAGLMVDANSALDSERSTAWIEALQPFGLEWFEEPLPLGTFAEQAALTRDSSIPICGNEGETGRDCVMRLLDEGCVDYLQIDLSICGGISAGIEYAQAAGEEDIPLTLHAAASAVLMLANLHLAAALAPSPLVESHMVHRWLYGYLNEGDLAVRDSCIMPPGRPGLGLTLAPKDLV